MKNKGLLLFWVDILSFIMLAAMLATGSLLKWVLPHGGEGGRHGIRARDATWLGISRHDWGDIHFWIAVVFSVLILFHLLLHMGWIRSALMKYLGINRMLHWFKSARAIKPITSH